MNLGLMVAMIVEMSRGSLSFFDAIIVLNLLWCVQHLVHDPMTSVSDVEHVLLCHARLSIWGQNLCWVYQPLYSGTIGQTLLFFMFAGEALAYGLIGIYLW